MNITIILPSGNLSLYGILFFCAAGFLYGFLFRNLGILKIIAIIIITPAIIQFLVDVNNLVEVTLPFLLFAVSGYLGKDKNLFYVKELYYSVKKLVSRRP